MSGTDIVEKLRRGLPASRVETLPELQQAAVLILLDKLESGVEVVLTQRAAHMRLHPGEVAFPGGKCDPDDPHPWATALREAREEIGLEPACVRRLGLMAPLTTRSEIQVTPCVGVLTQPVQFRVNPDELDAVFTVPLEFCSRPDSLQLDEVSYRGRLRRLPRYDYQQYTIWGITAAMLVQLVNIACDAGLQLDDYWKEEQE
ncbi:MAG: CoA pyrophosphatase [Gammaproteobacteria bacterium]|nr:CoA pyrophosphatase [Gammaproteobacteria bacterium]